MDFLLIDLPISGLEDFSLLVLVSIGFMAGVLGGFFGVGGAWIVTPALNIFGFPMAFAIGTDLAHILGKSIVATKTHGKMNNVDWRLGMLSITGSLLGIEIGKRLILFLESRGLDEEIVRWAYMVFLFSLGLFMVYEYVSTWLLESRQQDDWPKPGSDRIVEPRMPASARLQRISLPPLIALPGSGIKQISFWVLFTVFFSAGFFSGLMGIGGGFILLPCLIYLIGCPTTVAVGTSLLSVCLMSGYGTLMYSLAGRVDFHAAFAMLIGAAVGSQIGVLATRYVRGAGIRLLFAVMIILAGVSVGFKQSHSVFDLPVFGSFAAYTVMGASGLLTALIIVRLLIGAREQPQPNVPPRRPPIRR